MQKLVRWSGLVAMPGDVLGIVLTPILSYLWATYSDVYGYVGKAYFLVVLGCMVGLAGNYVRRGGNPGLRRTETLEQEKLVMGMTFFGLAMAPVGSVLDYWASRWRVHTGAAHGLQPRDDGDSGSAPGLGVARPRLSPYESLAEAGCPGAHPQRRHAPVLLRLCGDGIPAGDREVSFR